MSVVKFDKGETFNQFPNVFEDFFGKDFFNRVAPKVSVPSVNVKESDSKFEVFLAAPGLSKEDFNISVTDNVLTVSAENKQEKEETKEDGRFTRKEYSYSKFARSFTLPENADTETIAAKYENGELKLEIPKVNPVKPTVKQISVE